MSIRETRLPPNLLINPNATALVTHWQMLFFEDLCREAVFGLS
jgi:hypothetical protein